MDRYGSDKPDLRFGLELTELTDYLRGHHSACSPAPATSARWSCPAAPRRPAGAGRLAGLGQAARRQGPGLRPARARPASRPARSPRTSPTRARAGWPTRSAPSPATRSSSPPAPTREAQELLGAARVEIAQRTGLVDDERLGVLLGGRRADVRAADEGVASDDVAVGAAAGPPCTTPFTSPEAGVASTRSTTDPEQRARLRVRHRLQRQRDRRRLHPYPPRRRAERVFELLGIGRGGRRTKFGFLLEAFKYGAPPHGGIAFGWDRVCMLLAGADSIREVIAFPKTRGGFDPLTSAPAPITAAAAPGGRHRRQAGAEEGRVQEGSCRGQVGPAGGRAAAGASGPRDDGGAVPAQHTLRRHRPAFCVRSLCASLCPATAGPVPAVWSHRVPRAGGIPALGRHG